MDGEAPQRAAVTLTALPAPSRCRELVSGRAIAWEDRRAAFDIEAGDVRVLELAAP